MKRLFVAALLSLTASLLVVPSLFGATVTVKSEANIAGLQTDLTAFKTALTGQGLVTVTEDFTSYSTGFQNSLITSIGTFSVPATALPGTAAGDNNQQKQFNIRNNQVGSSFNGRYDTTNGGTARYLDSNDVSSIVLDFATAVKPVYAVAFSVTDPNDVGGLMTIVFQNGSTANVVGAQANGNLKFVSYLGNKANISEAISKVIWNSGSTAQSRVNDGFGLDSFVVGTGSPTPEPATFGLLGAALIGGYFVRRKQNC